MKAKHKQTKTSEQIRSMCTPTPLPTNNPCGYFLSTFFLAWIPEKL